LILGWLMLFAVLVAVMVIHVHGNDPSTTAEVISCDDCAHQQVHSPQKY